MFDDDDNTIQLTPVPETNAYQFTFLRQAVVTGPQGQMATQEQKVQVLASGTTLLEATQRFQEEVLDKEKKSELVMVQKAGKLEF